MDFDKDGEFDVAIEWNGILSFERSKLIMAEQAFSAKIPLDTGDAKIAVRHSNLFSSLIKRTVCSRWRKQNSEFEVTQGSYSSMRACQIKNRRENRLLCARVRTTTPVGRTLERPMFRDFALPKRTKHPGSRIASHKNQHNTFSWDASEQNRSANSD